jgi:hypothetical protein
MGSRWIFVEWLLQFLLAEASLKVGPVRLSRKEK